MTLHYRREQIQSLKKKTDVKRIVNVREIEAQVADVDKTQAAFIRGLSTPVTLTFHVRINWEMLKIESFRICCKNFAKEICRRFKF